MLNRLNKVIEIRTTRSAQNILEEIKIKKDNKESIILTPDSIKYSKFNIENNKILIKRNPHFFLPFRGIGEITMDFTEINDQTIIKCKIDTFKTEYLIWMAILGFIFLLMALPFILFGDYIVLPILLVGFCIILIWNYFWIRFNRNQLEDTLKYILTDLKLI
jgi:hypothetical protein